MKNARRFSSVAEVEVNVALPGVAPERVQVRVDHGTLRIEASRAAPINEWTTEIPGMNRSTIERSGFARTAAIALRHFPQ